MKRSHEPVFWALFGAGGMLSALLAPVLVFVTGIALPLGWLLPASAWDHARLSALAQHPPVKLVLLAVISLFLFHGCHRIRHSLRDLGFRGGRGAALVLYGVAIAGTLVAGWFLS